MEALVPILVQLVAGAVGGNLAGAVKNLSLGTTGNTVAGGIGGLILSQILPMLTGGNADLSGIVGQLIGGGAGGAVLTAIIGLIKNNLVNKS
ncbi:hypothetical protein [Pseudochrobactrum sp. HB0163]|uniref:hypothetical protein n=1 Tax=Pseudochrobactrum sp. HB0163 TaxID=3450708 RepID=UPI003F6DF296